VRTLKSDILLVLVLLFLSHLVAQILLESLDLPGNIYTITNTDSGIIHPKLQYYLYIVLFEYHLFYFYIALINTHFSFSHFSFYIDINYNKFTVFHLVAKATFRTSNFLFLYLIFIVFYFIFICIFTIIFISFI